MQKKLTILLFFSSLVLVAQEGPIKRSVEFDDVFASRVFASKGVYGLRSMEDGLHYSRQTKKGIEKFEFKSGESKGVLISNGDALDTQGNDIPLRSYTWIKGETKAIIETEIESIYRHSYRAKT